LKRGVSSSLSYGKNWAYLQVYNCNTKKICGFAIWINDKNVDLRLAGWHTSEFGFVKGDLLTF
jgi:hypothetical protein